MKLNPIVMNVTATLDPGTAKAFRDMAAALTAFVDAPTPADSPEPVTHLTADYLDAMRIGATVTDCDGDPWTKQEADGRWTFNDGGLIETSLNLVRVYGPIQVAQ